MSWAGERSCSQERECRWAFRGCVGQGGVVVVGS